MNILLDANVRFGEEFFGDLGAVRLCPGAKITRADVKWADVLICRSQVRVNADLLGDSKLLFVGTATAGMDHLDQHFLRMRGIPYAGAPGCNAHSVANYVIACIFLWVLTSGRDLSGLSVGIIGCGHVGGTLLRQLQKIGLKVKVSDPPLAARPGVNLPFYSLEEVLESDIVALHVPLVTTGAWPTHRLLDSRVLEKVPEGALLLSCGRGEVVDSQALTTWAARSSNYLVNDVWEAEPRIDQALLAAAWIATPHIAGYSLDGRANGARMLRVTLSELLGQPEYAEPPIAELQPPEPLFLPVDSVKEALIAVVDIYDPRLEDQAFRASQQSAAKASEAFLQMRRGYRMRRDAGQYVIQGASGRAAEILSAVGFRVAAEGSTPPA